ncbi:MAG: hypothetical protein AB7O98_06445 [Hyphomonadaceae bacterium]
MKRFAVALAFGLFAAGAAFADTIENGYGNTFVVTLGDGTSARYHFNADGTFAATGPDGSTMNGRYEVANGQLCFLGEGDARQCTELVAGKNVGDTWQQTDANGNQITVSLEAGR